MEKYITPELDIKAFSNSDIITSSGKDSSSYTSSSSTSSSGGGSPWDEDVSHKN